MYASWADSSLLSVLTWEKFCDCQVGKNLYNHQNDTLEQFANYSENSNGEMKSVASLRANKFNLYDMQGNVWEWCYSDREKDIAITKGGSFRAFPEMCFKSVDLEEYKKFYYMDLSFRIQKVEE